MSKLLIVAQKIDANDENLGFFHKWVEEFSQHFSRVTIIAASVGTHDFKDQIHVYSLGKEKGASRFLRIWKFLELFSHHYSESDIVFFHMIPEFVVAASPFLLSLKKTTGLWYVHRSVTRNLKIAEWLVDFIFTASPLSFRMPSKKVIYTGHAIDTDRFVAGPKSHGAGIRLLILGRISPIKDIETVIRACAILKSNWENPWTLSIVGGPIMERDYGYLEMLKRSVRDMGLEKNIVFEGPRPYSEIERVYQEHDIFISMSTTGSVDKAVLEACAAGLTVLTANEAFSELLNPPYFLERRSPELLAGRIKSLASENRPNLRLRELVIKNHGLKNTIKKISEILQKY